MRNRKFGMVVLIILASLPALFLVLAQHSLKGFAGLKPGDSLPRARLQSTSQSWVETDTWPGTPTLLVVVQPGCGACRSEIDALTSISASFPGIRIALLSTQLEIAGMHTPFPIYVDPEGRFLSRVRRLVTPTVYWIDASGEVRYVRVGPRSAAEEAGIVRKLLQEARQ